MSVLEPPDDEDPTDAEIIDEAQASADADVLAGLEDQFADVELPEPENVRDLTPTELLTRFAAVERKLREMQELHGPRTQGGRDLHSERTAYLVELRRRKMR